MKNHEVKNLLVTQHLSIVGEVCKKFSNLTERIGKDESIAIGNLALVLASRKWQGRGVFAAYATTAITNALRYELKKKISPVQLNGYDPEDYRDDSLARKRSDSIMTSDDERFLRLVEETKKCLDGAHIELSQRRKQPICKIRRRHRMIFKRVEES